MRAARIVGRALPALLLWLSAAGCEILIDGDLGSIHCTDEGQTGPPACPEGLTCTNLVCVEIARPPGSLGIACQRDDECAPGTFCLDPARFTGAGPFTEGNPRCSRPCCASSECGEPSTRTVCAHPALGGPGFCRDAGELHLAQPGARRAGEACGSDGECRSGRCDPGTSPGTCLDSCCSDPSCAATKGACRFELRDQRRGFFCSNDLQGKAYGEACQSHGDCASGLCFDFDAHKRCSAPCCSSSQCPDLDGAPVACGEILAEGVFVRACSQVLTPAASGDTGKACTVDGTCRGGVCALTSPAEGMCTGACCSDDGCGDPGSFRCRPRLDGPPWALRCEHK